MDDDPRVVGLLQAYFNDKRWECVTAADGDQGFALARDSRFDLLLVDLGLPGMDGIAVTREVHAACPGVPVILMTGNASTDNAIRALRHGAADFITKPFHLRTLDEAIDRALASRAGASDCVKSPPVVLHDASTDETLRRSVSDLLTMLESDPSASTFTEPAPEHFSDLARTELLVGALADAMSLSQAEAHVMRWAARLSTADVERLGALERLGAAARIARMRHERWDGTGPQGVRDQSIPLESRCLAVAEAAVAAANPDSTLPLDDMHAVLARGAGKAFDPSIARLCRDLPEDLFVLVASRNPAEALSVRD
ncbi:MAG: response regulator [Planctomycetes bacterium]|nr:response regulator [Planctomycetota bacterium]